MHYSLGRLMLLVGNFLTLPLSKTETTSRPFPSLSRKSITANFGAFELTYDFASETDDAP